MKFKSNIKNFKGFTIIELAVSISVLAVLIAIAIPSSVNIVDNSRATGQAITLISSMNYGKSEAIKRNTNVIVCASTDSETCSTSWTSGWIVYYTDSNGNNDVLSSSPALTGNNTLINESNNSSITFTGGGNVVAGSSFTLCDARGNEFAREIQITPAGTILSSNILGTGVSGESLTCT